MQRVIPTEPFNADPDARYLREASRPGPVVEPDPAPTPGGWLLLCLAGLVALALALSACADAGAAQEAPSVADLKRAAASAWNCPGMHAEWIDEQTIQCLKERP